MADAFLAEWRISSKPNARNHLSIVYFFLAKDGTLSRNGCDGHQLAGMRGFGTLWRRVTPNLKTQAGGSVEGKVMAISPICG
jgi:hypothetical protein